MRLSYVFVVLFCCGVFSGNSFGEDDVLPGGWTDFLEAIEQIPITEGSAPAEKAKFAELVVERFYLMTPKELATQLTWDPIHRERVAVAADFLRAESRRLLDDAYRHTYGRGDISAYSYLQAGFASLFVSPFTVAAGGVVGAGVGWLMGGEPGMYWGSGMGSLAGLVAPPFVLYRGFQEMLIGDTWLEKMKKMAQQDKILNSRLVDPALNETGRGTLSMKIFGCNEALAKIK